MKTVCVRGIEIGAGIPKIAVSLTGATEEELLAQAAALGDLGADVAEWRMDCFSGAENGSAVENCLRALRRALGDTPLLATFRTAREGGQRRLSGENYAALCEFVIASGQADLLDVELFSGEDTVQRLIAAAHAAALPVLLSSHDFEKTPPRAEMVSRLCRMQELGGDLLKLAVMPRSKEDVVALLSATEEMAARHAERPLITMSMGHLGAISRVCGQFFGSAMTFGAAAEASAPGQIDARRLSGLLAALDRDVF